MNYLSTRDGAAVNAAQAIEMGICPSGGLFVPASFPALNLQQIVSRGEHYQAIAFDVMSPFLTETEKTKLFAMIESAYKSFDDPRVCPLLPLTKTESVLELWHGPTMAFKDIALQMLPHLMKEAVRQSGDNRGVYILVATSGDTGKAALEGFADVPGTRVLVFYPHGGVSEAQRLQMVTQEGGNVDACAVRGNFDDAQTGVKAIFRDARTAEELAGLGWRLSSANSINFGRLLPQIAYYFSAYAALCDSGKIKKGMLVNFCVPTGNFGDILAGYYAMRMGLPVNRLICASNRNNVLTDFFRTGVYNVSRPFYRSMSCSIDILISSNLERLLFEVADRNPELVKAWMQSLAETGAYDIGKKRLDALSSFFWADCCDEDDTLRTIRRVFDETGYLMDPHTAVAQTIYDRYREELADGTQTVLLSTANPFKFATDVLGAFEQPGADDFDNAERLGRAAGRSVPQGIRGLRGKRELHTDVCELADMRRRVLDGVKKG